MAKINNEVRYFTFPIAILRSGAVNMYSDAIYYSIYAKMIEFDNLKKATTFLGVSLNDGHEIMVMSRGKQLFETHGQNCTMVSVNTDILFSIMQNTNRTNFEVATFLAYCGLKSILGTNAYTKTNNDHLIARMAGYSTYSEYVVASASVNRYFENFSTPQKIRYQLTEKIIRRELVLNWGLKYYSQNTKGFYFGFDIDLEKLVYFAEVSRKSNRLKVQKAKEVEAIRAAKDRLVRCG